MDKFKPEFRGDKVPEFTPKYSDCLHNFRYQTMVKMLRDDKVEEAWDVYYCVRCLTHVKKLRQCPKDITTVIENE